MASLKMADNRDSDGVLETGDYSRIIIKPQLSHHMSSVNEFEKLQEYCQGESNKLKCGDRFVVLANNPCRQVWNIILLVLLLYTGTILPYRITFLDFGIPERIKPSTGWKIFDNVIDALFWMDLIVNFFFSVEQENGFEVVSFHRIVSIYLRGYFAINLIACIPEQAIQEALLLFHTPTSGEDDLPGSAAPQLSRVARLNRISRLARLVRLLRLVKISSVISNNKAWKALQEMRGIRITNFAVGLIWVCHMMACAWYLVAWLHTDSQDTWLSRRSNADGVPLAETSAPFEHWVTCLYFVLTVFTTVGFGDMSASSVGEMFSCCIMMLIGAVVNSIIVGEMINVVTARDDADIEFSNRQELMSTFARHTRLDDETKDIIDKWVRTTRGTPAEHHDHRAAMHEMLTGAKVPRTILDILPDKVFGGKIKRNQLLTTCLTRALTLPPRLILQIALSVKECWYKERDIIYQIYDHPFNMFLVQSGTFAHVARPSESGGVSESVHLKAPAPSKARLTQDGEVSNINSVATRRTYFPYQLFSSRSYLGEEILTSGSRHGTARCETFEGCTLVLHKSSLVQLTQEFPHFADAWIHCAFRRENARRALLRKFRIGRSYKDLAAATLQRFWRMVLPSFGEASAARERIRKERPATRYTIINQVGEVQAKKHATPATQADVNALRNEMRKSMEEVRSLIKDSMKSLREEVFCALPQPVNLASNPPQVRAQVTPQDNDQFPEHDEAI